MRLNCDMGESFGLWAMGEDAQVMPWIDMANIACGFHASDPQTMAKTVELAVRHGVQIGAHPGYEDKPGFGRRSIPHALPSITQLLVYQVGALDGICTLYDSHVSYVKPHGALYNDMMARPEIFEAILKAIAALNQQRKEPLPLMILARSDNRAYSDLARDYQVSLLCEAFADRAYSADGALAPRGQTGSVYQDPQQIKRQVVELAAGRVTSIEGQSLKLSADTICVHGDNRASMEIISELRGLMAKND
ncbi:5-oxoprolinase subunit PxpA [Dongshaea marina]|uniref:5-oxoprolinase subunit PxpA n=1 Tax=Dongshaea marina TaxID=2047966 RepID=UPI000D3E689F|nr:5-oxoprolinase subunit PxpA [Dongshaea marina]